MDIYELLKLLGKNVVQQYAGAGEAGLSAATGIVSGAAAPIGGAIATLQNNGANPYEQEMMNFMQRNTYAPRTEVGQQRAEQIGEFANRNLVPIAPMLEGLALPLTAGSKVRYNPTAARATMEKIVPDYVSGGNIGKAANSNDVVAAMMNDPQLKGFADYFQQNVGKPVENVVPYAEANRVPQEAVKVDNGLLQANADKRLADYNSRGFTKDVIAKAQQEFDKTGKLPAGYVASKEDGVLYPKPSSLLEDVTDFGKPVPAGQQDTVTLRHNTSGKEIVVTKEGAKSSFYTKEWTPVDHHLEAVQANPMYFLQKYDKLGAGNPKSPFYTDNGRIVNTDIMRELPETQTSSGKPYNLDRTKSAEVHEAASWLTKQQYKRKLEEPTPTGYDNIVTFTAGGTGAGKSSSLDSLGALTDKSKVIYDTNMNGLDSSVTKIEQALNKNKQFGDYPSNKVDIYYTYRDPIDALNAGALGRASRMEKAAETKAGGGRTVPLSEHLKTHIGARETIPKLMEKYKDNPDVRFVVIDNSKGHGKAVETSIDKLPKINENTTAEKLKAALEKAKNDKSISEAIYKGTKGD